MSRHNNRDRPRLRCGHGARPRHLGICPTGKTRFPDHTAAVGALHRAATTRHFAELDGRTTNRHEVRSYRCTECKGWHLTSQPQHGQHAPANSADSPAGEAGN